MEEAKRSRKLTRAAFSKGYSAFQATFSEKRLLEEKTVAFQLLKIKMAELNEVHSAYNKELFSSKMDDNAIELEMKSDDIYLENFLRAKSKLYGSQKQEVEPTPWIIASQEKASMKLPNIELPKFNGSVKEWLPFWSQFRKINDDETMHKEDKFQYLLQATVPGSRAQDIVKSFPPTGANYGKAIQCLKNRFGRDEIVVEYYVRELLGLVLQNAIKGNKKTTLAILYDKIESNIRALDSLGVAADSRAAMLYPLVESSLPEDTLRAWQRSGQRAENQAETQASDVEKDRLTKLLEFLQWEVENEERIDMALTGLGLSAGTKENGNGKPKSRSETTNQVASASVLLVSKEERYVECIFCRANYESINCEKARKLSLDECKEIVKKENTCFYCLRRGHIAKKCRIRVKCEWCSKRHALVMCTEIRNKEKLEESKKVEVEKALATFSESAPICLQTLKVKVYSNTMEKIVRAVIDTASQRSYIRSDLAKDLGYLPIEEKAIVHSLFGGVKSKCEKHKIFLVRMKSLNNSFACNFAVMNQEVICDNIASLRYDSWVGELRKNNIELTDLDGDSGKIEVLIGADVAGKLLTGKKFDLNNGLAAFETLLGWTVMGKIPKHSERVDPVVKLTSMFVRDAEISDLWQLDTLGISDPTEKSQKSLKEQETLDFLIKTAKIAPAGRYEIKLPWVMDHAPLPSNFEISRGRLEKCLVKLKKQNLVEAYDGVFREWEAEGIIARERDIEEAETRYHYLPHRPVIKAVGTTKIRPVFDASAKEKGYPSLNNCLQKGPNLIELIPSALNRFREGDIGVWLAVLFY